MQSNFIYKINLVSRVFKHLVSVVSTLGYHCSCRAIGVTNEMLDCHLIDCGSPTAVKVQNCYLIPLSPPGVWSP